MDFLLQYKDMLRTVQLCQYLKEFKKIYQGEVNSLLSNRGIIYGSPRLYFGGVPMDKYVEYVQEKEKELYSKKQRKSGRKRMLLGYMEKEQRNKIQQEVESRMPAFIAEKGGTVISPDSKGIIIESSVIDLTGDGNSIVNEGFMKYAHRFKFWAKEWQTPTNILISFGAGAILCNWIIIPIIHISQKIIIVVINHKWGKPLF